jgi:hypothetical protein
LAFLTPGQESLFFNIWQSPKGSRALIENQRHKNKSISLYFL